MDGHHWHFNKDTLVLRKVQSNVQPSAIIFTSVPFWIQIHDMSMEGRSLEVLQNICSRMGTFLSINEESMADLSRSIRIWVKINLQKPLRQGMKVVIEGSTFWHPINKNTLHLFVINADT